MSCTLLSNAHWRCGPLTGATPSGSLGDVGHGVTWVRLCGSNIHLAEVLTMVRAFRNAYAAMNLRE